jgi:CheY-like chemotaxis protein/HPt (histidine-containing phosphotransfer) domain-containing protein
MSFTAPDARILVVDDIHTNLKVAEGLMLPYKMQVDMCRSGRDAIDTVVYKHYDLIFMDHKMPDMDGVEATLNIRKMGEKWPYYKNVPVIALTANAVSGTREMFLENGFDDFMSKPIDTVKLNAILRKWIPKEKQKSATGDDSALDVKNGQGAESGIAIEGLDVNRGIFLSGGTEEIYLETLAIFLKDGNEKIKDIKSCLESGNLSLYTIHVHALKSASANVGADRLSETAKSLELAGAKNDFSFISSNTGSFLADLEQLLKNISGFLSAQTLKSEEEKNTNDKEKLLSAFVELKIALDTLDAGIMNRTIDDMRKIAQTNEIRNVVNDISEKILIGEYDEASALIESLLLEMNDGEG